MTSRTLIIFPPSAIAQGCRQSLESEFANVLEVQTYAAVREDLARSFLHAIAPLVGGMTESDLIRTYAPVFVGKPLEIAVYEHESPQVFPGLKGGVAALHLCDLARPSFAFQVLCDGAYIFCSQPEEVDSIGGFFFWKTVHEKTRFRSENPQLMESVYFPVQLAKDGAGLFFEERIVRRLFDLGILPSTAQAEMIEDGGGWSTLDELTASLTVHYTSGGEKCTGTLLGTALTPAPPITPTALCDLIEQRSAFLREVGIRPSVLRAEHGVVYHRKVTPFVKALQAVTHDNQRRNLVSQCAKIAAILDADFWDKALPTLDLGSWGQFSDYLEISSLDDAVMQKSFLDALGVDSSEVYWVEFNRSPQAFRGRGAFSGSWCWNVLSEKLDDDERLDVSATYLVCKMKADELVN